MLLGSVSLSRGNLVEARAHYEQALALSRAAGPDEEGSAVPALGNLAQVAMLQGRLEEAQEYGEQHIALARKSGDRVNTLIATGTLANILNLRQRLDESLALHAEHLAMCREIGMRMAEAVGLVNTGSVWLALGDPGRARRVFSESLTISREFGAQVPEGYALFYLARVADEEADSEGAARLFEESLAHRRAIDDGLGTADSLRFLGELHLRTGDHDEARLCLTEALGLLEEQARETDLARTRALLACLPGGEVEAAISDDLGAVEWQALWRATDKKEYLLRARRHIDEQLAGIPVKYHEAILQHVRENREVLAACEEAGLSA